MRRSVRILRRAQSDLEEIHRYIERDRPDAAAGLIDRLFDGIEALGRLPKRGSLPRDDRLRSLGFRVLVIGDHLVFYKIIRTHVRVYRVIHGRRSYAQLI